MANICTRPVSKTGKSSSVEDYLEAILVLSQESGASARITDLSEQLGVSKPSVSAAVRRLAEAGLAVHERYGDVRLTRSGRKRAKEVASRHSLLHRFLAEILGVEDETAQADACRLEHDLSEESVHRLTLFVEFLIGGRSEDAKGWLNFGEYIARGVHHEDLVDGS